MTSRLRLQLVTRLSQVLSRKSYPRIQMALMMGATGLTGFLASFVMLRLGLEAMWLRYPLAVAASYGAFLLLLKLWIIYQQRSLTDDLLDAADLDPTDFCPSLRSTGRGADSDCADSPGWADFASSLDAGEWAAVIVILVALLIAAVASLFIVLSAPVLLAEVMLDGMVVAGLRRTLLRHAEQHWTWGVLRRTALPFATVALIFSLAGAIVQQVRPEAKSVGGIFHAERVK